MALVEIPKLNFSQWEEASKRSRLAEEFDVPETFGLLGLYLLASSPSAPDSENAPDLTELPESIFYVGMSTHVDRRIEKYHRAKARKLKGSSIAGDVVWISHWYSDWSNTNLTERDGVIALARLATYERAVIQLYAEKHGRLPEFNRQ